MDLESYLAFYRFSSSKTGATFTAKTNPYKNKTGLFRFDAAL